MTVVPCPHAESELPAPGADVLENRLDNEAAEEENTLGVVAVAVEKVRKRDSHMSVKDVEGTVDEALSALYAVLLDPAPDHFDDNTPERTDVEDPENLADVDSPREVVLLHLLLVDSRIRRERKQMFPDIVPSSRKLIRDFEESLLGSHDVLPRVPQTPPPVASTAACSCHV